MLYSPSVSFFRKFVNLLYNIYSNDTDKRYIHTMRSVTTNIYDRNIVLYVKQGSPDVKELIIL